jgi:hypothetical protein
MHAKYTAFISDSDGYADTEDQSHKVDPSPTYSDTHMVVLC